jgi:hypothetical protein
MIVCVVITVAMVMLLREFGALWDNIYDYVIIYPWPTRRMYFYTQQHSYYNLNIRSYLILH